LLAAGCGGGSSGAGVAQLGANTTSTNTSSSSGGSGNADPAAFSACMRENGVPTFPDPDSQGRIRLGGQTANGRKVGLDPNSRQFKRALQACRRLLPAAKTPQQLATDREQALRFSRCVRAHGVPKFPDPAVGANGRIEFPVAAGSHLDKNSPQFRAARKACEKLIPGAARGPAPGQKR
jgi:hypothetical protein